MIYPILSLKVLIFSIWTDKRLPAPSQQVEHLLNMFTGNNKETGTTPLSSFLILNSFHALFLCLSYLLWTVSSLLEWMILQTKPHEIKSFLSFNFSITNVCGAICLAEDGTRMVAYSFNYPLVLFRNGLT